MRYMLLSLVANCIATALSGQIVWRNVDSLYQPLPASVKIYYSDRQIDSSNFRAFYLIADLTDKALNFTTDTTLGRRFTPDQFFAENDSPLVVVNGTFFSFESNRNLNVVIKDGRTVAHNAKSVKSFSDTLQTIPVYNGAIGITKRRRADVAWIRTDSSRSYASAVQHPYMTDGLVRTKQGQEPPAGNNRFRKWKMQSAIGGGPVLIQKGDIKITNEEERQFAGKAIRDKHPRTAMGYTADRKLVILVVEGRNPAATGATLGEEAQILKDLGCVEALNLDGGGSSCLLVNGKETISPSDKKQRAVPAVFIISKKK